MRHAREAGEDDIVSHRGSLAPGDAPQADLRPSRQPAPSQPLQQPGFSRASRQTEFSQPSHQVEPALPSSSSPSGVPQSGFVPATARLRMAPSTSRLGTVRGFTNREGDSGRSRQRIEGESALDRLVDDLTENAGASDDFSVRSVFRAISDDARANKQGMGLQAARDAAAEALGRLKATLPTHREADDPHASPPGRKRSIRAGMAKGRGKASRRP